MFGEGGPSAVVGGASLVQVVLGRKQAELAAEQDF